MTPEELMSEKGIQQLRKFLSGNDIAEIDKYEAEQIFNLVLKMDAWQSNIGHRVERIKYNDLEKAFHETWLKWNEPRVGVNYGNGTLQDLFIEKGERPFSRKWIADISNRERWIVATVIQWLGTNVGMAFLHEALGAAGMYIVQKTK